MCVCVCACVRACVCVCVCRGHPESRITLALFSEFHSSTPIVLLCYTLLIVSFPTNSKFCVYVEPQHV